MKRKGAFTLIELLVVIAIIAILAAILFPVFAQAKEAAKKTAAISNNKQMTLASLMYEGDYDDHFPIAAWSESFWFGNVPDSNPEDMMFPYMKNQGIMMDPMDPASFTQREWPDTSLVDPFGPPFNATIALYNFCMTADWGINFQYFDPVFYYTSDGTYHQFGINQTSIVRPADTYLAFSSVWGRTPQGAPYGGGNAGVDPPCVYLPGNVDTRPNATPNGWYWYGAWQPTQPLAWNVFGGVWPWYNSHQQIVVSYADGHAKSAQLTSITAGCNVLDSWGGFITDETSYHWSSTF